MIPTALDFGGKQTERLSVAASDPDRATEEIRQTKMARADGLNPLSKTSVTWYEEGLQRQLTVR